MRNLILYPVYGQEQKLVKTGVSGGAFGDRPPCIASRIISVNYFCNLGVLCRFF